MKTIIGGGTRHGWKMIDSELLDLGIKWMVEIMLEDRNRGEGKGDTLQKFRLQLGVGTRLSVGAIDSRLSLGMTTSFWRRCRGTKLRKS